jgi:hypothetical protein
MDYGFTEEEILLIWHALTEMKRDRESRQNSKENRSELRRIQTVMDKLSSQDPNFRLLALAKERFRSSEP